MPQPRFCSAKVASRLVGVGLGEEEVVVALMRRRAPWVDWKLEA